MSVMDTLAIDEIYEDFQNTQVEEPALDREKPSKNIGIHECGQEKDKGVGTRRALIEDVYRHTREELIKDDYFEIWRITGDKYAILYTPHIDRPDFMIVGTNPSMFSPADTEEEADILEEMAGVPGHNSYIEDPHRFADQTRKIFKRLGCYDLLELCAGANVFHIQATKIEDLKHFPNYKKLKNFCRLNTIRLIQIIEPRLVLAVGNTAQKELPKETIKGIYGASVQILGVRHPSQGSSHKQLDKSWGDALRHAGLLP